MNLYTLLSGLLVVAIIILPLLYFYWKNQAKTKRMNNLLIEFAQKNRLLINNSDFLEDLAIGIDATKNVLLYIKIINNTEHREMVDLNTQKKCTLFVQRSQGESKSIEFISLVIVSKSQTEVSLELYNSNSNVPLSNELSMGEKWTKIITQQIK